MNKNGVKNILFSSTAGVYDTIQNIPPYVESDEINPASPYGTTKRVCERMIKDLSQNQFFNGIILRYFNVIGAHESGMLGEMPNGTPQNLLPLLFQSLTGERDGIKVFGKDYETPDGTCIRDYIHVMDVAQAHVYALEYLNQYLDIQNNEEVVVEKGLFDVFNIGMGAGTTVLEMIDLVQKVTGKDINFEIVERRA
jgi:UDP-glucose 4-epimerase